MSDEEKESLLLHDTLEEKPLKGEKHVEKPLKGEKHVDGEKNVDGMDLPRLSSKQVLWRLFRLSRQELRLLSVATLALILSSAAGMLIPLLAGAMIDAVSAEVDDVDEGRASLNRATGLMFIALSASSVFSFLRNLCFTLAGERIVARLRRVLFTAIMAQEIGFFDQTRTGELVNRLSSDAQIIQNAATVNISMALRFFGQMVAGVCFLFYISWRLTLVMLCVIPLIVPAAVFYGRYVRKISKLVQDALARSAEVATEVLGSIRTVRAFSNDEREVGKYDAQIDESYRLAAKRAVARGSFGGVAGWLGGLSVILVLWYGGTLVLKGELSPGKLTSFVLYTLTVSFALGGLMEVFGDFMKAIGSSERVFQLIDREPLLSRDRGKSIPRSSVRGYVEFKDVTFRYPTRPDTAVLQHFNVSLSPGKVVALVGASGGGKSTCVSLLLNFYAPQEGQILLDGLDMRTLNASQCRRHFAVVAQEPTLFATSIADNISYGVESATREEIIAAARVANAHDFVSSFEDGYDTLVGERGVKLSGGQKQRIAIARAVLRDPVVLLLDEATSALDAESEHLVKDALDKLMVGRTVLVIAHRLSTVIGADQVVVVDGGKVAERGTHDELMAIDSGLYKMLVSRQLKAD